MNNRAVKIVLLSVGLLALAGLFALINEQIYGENPNETAARLSSLGTPKVVKLEKSEGEKSVLMNDPSIQKNWGLMGTAGASDIKANRAWDISQGDRRVVVAIIDTGVDITHPDLAANIWVNPGESGLDSKGRDKATNGIDDDGDGYVDDLNGWDFVNDKPINSKLIAQQNVAIDHHGHGTHIAGIVGAVGGNGIGISGVCPKVSLMVLKYFDPVSKNNDNLRNTVRAIKYAVMKGANIINYSGGGTEPNDDEFNAVKLASDHGILFVAAAGNERSNSDVAHYYPADYNLANIISVTAINTAAQILNSSNFGEKTVHIAAPGEGIYSTLPYGNYGLMTGTSQATAFVSGVAALILSHNKDFSAAQVKNQILSTADPLPGLQNKTRSGGKLNSYAALAIQPNIPATGIANSDASKMSVGVVGETTVAGSPGTLQQSALLGNDEPSSNSAALKNFVKSISKRSAAGTASPL